MLPHPIRAMVLVLLVAPLGAARGQAFLERQELFASDGAPFDEFGGAISISGDHAVVGAQFDDDHGSMSGSAYVFERQAAGWVQVQKLVPNDGASLDRFGYSVSISGDRIVIGAYLDGDNGTVSGSAYVFERQAGGAWAQVQKLLPNDGASGDTFGEGVAVSGDDILVGATGDDDNGSRSGSAYVFRRQPGGAWLQVQKLVASNGKVDDIFGNAISMSDDRAFVAAWGNDDGAAGAGAVYVFERQANGAWLEVQELLASDAAANAHFGSAVSVSADRGVVGAPNHTHNGVVATGAVYVFERQASGTWLEVREALPNDSGQSDRFGSSTSISGDRFVAGASTDLWGGKYYGSAYVFERAAGGAWSQAQKLTASDAVEYDYFGNAAAVWGDRILVGAHQDDDNGGDAGAVYVFERPVCAPDLGFQGPGSITLSVCGDDLTTAGSAATFSLTLAPPNSLVLLFGGLVYGPTPVPGTLGTLVPIPVLGGFPLALPTNASGAVSFGVAGGPLTPVTVYLQAVAQNGTVVEFSNAVPLTLGF